jgi:hypothetical protein
LDDAVTWKELKERAEQERVPDDAVIIISGPDSPPFEVEASEASCRRGINPGDPMRFEIE